MLLKFFSYVSFETPSPEPSMTFSVMRNFEASLFMGRLKSENLTSARQSMPDEICVYQHDAIDGFAVGLLSIGGCHWLDGYINAMHSI